MTPEERERGERLGRLLREARGGRSMAEVAAAAGISAETLRKIETGRAPTPAFFTVAALAEVLGLSMDELAGRCCSAVADEPRQGRGELRDQPANHPHAAGKPVCGSCVHVVNLPAPEPSARRKRQPRKTNVAPS